MTVPILLTGATGNTGQVIAEELTRRGVPFVAMTRSASSRARLDALGIPSIGADFDDPVSLDRALRGVEKAYLVCTPDEKLIPREVAFIDAAKRAGVRHIVKCSAFFAGLDAPTQNLRSHGEIERQLIASGIDYTILRPNGFMQTFTHFGWDLIEKAGVMSMPAGDGGIPLVDVRDVAAAAIKALTEPGHVGKIYDLSGPEALTMYQAAEILQRALGRPVTYIPGTERQMAAVSWLLGVPRVPAEHVIKIFRMLREHRFEETLPTLRELGISPTTYEQFVADLVSGRTGGGNSFQPPDTMFARALGRVMPAAGRLMLLLHRPKRG